MPENHVPEVKKISPAYYYNLAEQDKSPGAADENHGFLESGIHLAKKNNDQVMELRGLILLAGFFLAQSNADSAKKLFGRCRKLLSSLGTHSDHDDFLARIYELEAQTYQLSGEYEKAFRCWFDFLEAADNCRSYDFLIARVYLGLGGLYQVGSYNEDAGKCYRYALNNSLARNDHLTIVKSGLHLASILLEKGSYDELNDLLEQIRSFWLPDMDIEWDIDYGNFRCAYLYHSGRFDESETLLKSQLKKAGKNSYIWGYWKSAELLSSIFQDRNEFEEAAALLEGCINYSSDTGYFLPPSAYIKASVLWEKAEDFAKALAYLKEYRNLRINETVNFARGKLILKGMKARYYETLLENHYLRHQLQALKGDGRP